MKHLARAGILFAVVIAGLIYVRGMTTVLSVEVIGITHEDNPRVWASRTVNNQDPATCAECHAATQKSWSGSAHLGVVCEDCHGATKDHIAKARNKEDASLAMADAKDLCLMCHAKIAGRPSSFPQVDPATHPEQLKGTSASCASCHSPHNPGIPPEFTHSLEGRTVCLNCHAPDKWRPFPADHKGREGTTCLTCHRAKEGS